MGGGGAKKKTSFARFQYKIGIAEKKDYGNLVLFKKKKKWNLKSSNGLRKLRDFLNEN